MKQTLNNLPNIFEKKLLWTFGRQQKIYFNTILSATGNFGVLYLHLNAWYWLLNDKSIVMTMFECSWCLKL